MIQVEPYTDHEGYFHFVYKTIHKPTGRFYIGKHSTKKAPDDCGYFGSGTRIKRLLNKYPRRDFERQIVGFFDNAQYAFDFEHMLIKQMKNEECLNLSTIHQQHHSVDRKTHSNLMKEAYQKKPTMIMNAVKRNSKRVQCSEGFVYNSIRECARSKGLSHTTIQRRIKSPNFDYSLI